LTSDVRAPGGESRDVLTDFIVQPDSNSSIDGRYVDETIVFTCNTLPVLLLAFIVGFGSGNPNTRKLFWQRGRSCRLTRETGSGHADRQ